MYEYLLQSLWPTLLALPWVIGRIASQWRRPIVLMLGILVSIYVLGWITGRHSYGRVLSFIVLLLHIEIARALSSLEGRASGRAWWRRAAVPAGVMVAAVLLSWRPIVRTFVNPPAAGPSYAFLERLTGQDDVVLADLTTSEFVPVFGGKVVASRHPFAFVADQAVRQGDVRRYFAAGTVTDEREAIRERYGVGYLLLTKASDAAWQDLARDSASWGRAVFEDDNFLLIARGR